MEYNPSEENKDNNIKSSKSKVLISTYEIILAL